MRQHTYAAGLALVLLAAVGCATSVAPEPTPVVTAPAGQVVASAGQAGAPDGNQEQPEAPPAQPTPPVAQPEPEPEPEPAPPLPEVIPLPPVPPAAPAVTCADRAAWSTDDGLTWTVRNESDEATWCSAVMWTMPAPYGAPEWDDQTYFDKATVLVAPHSIGVLTLLRPCGTLWQSDGYAATLEALGPNAENGHPRTLHVKNATHYLAAEATPCPPQPPCQEEASAWLGGSGPCGPPPCKADGWGRRERCAPPCEGVSSTGVWPPCEAGL